MMNNNDDSVGADGPPLDQQPPQQQQLQVPLIQDFDHYLEQNGLGHRSNNDDPTEDQRELASRVQEAESYKNSVLRGFLEKDEKEAQLKEQDQMEQRREVVKECQNSM